MYQLTKEQIYALSIFVGALLDVRSPVPPDMYKAIYALMVSKGKRITEEEVQRVQEILVEAGVLGRTTTEATDA